MALSKVALLCLESSSYFTQDILDSRNPRTSVHKLNKESCNYDEFRDLYKQCRKYPEKFYEYVKMSVETFDYIVQHIEIHMQQQKRFKRILTISEKLFLTLRYLAHGISFKSLSQSYHLGRSTVSKIIYRILKAIWKALNKLHMPRPSQEDLKNIAEGFFLKWQFPNCIGSIDEKHFRILKPARDGNNSKKYFLLALQAISDADYKFVGIEVGQNSHQSVGNTFNDSVLNKLLANNRFNVPPPQHLPGTTITLPHVLLGNEAYPLKTYLMRPYPALNLSREKMIFNERLSRARVTIERAFALLSHKWRIFTDSIQTNPKHAHLIIRVTCVLHNIVRQKDGNNDENYKEIINTLSSYKKVTRSRLSRCNNRASFQAIDIRDQYKDYFLNN